MRYPATNLHPLVERLYDAREYNNWGSKLKAQRMLNDICDDLDKTEAELDKEKKRHVNDDLGAGADGFGWSEWTKAGYYNGQRASGGVYGRSQLSWKEQRDLEAHAGLVDPDRDKDWWE